MSSINAGVVRIRATGGPTKPGLAPSSINRLNMLVTVKSRKRSIVQSSHIVKKIKEA